MSDPLDRIFHALSDPTRRAILARLMAGPATVSELAAPLSIAMPTLLAHIARLEAAGLVRSGKTGRVRRLRANPVALGPARKWIGGRQADWDARAASLARRARGGTD
jgi:DNA-binding transcriptional ArsR family regulator